MRLLIDTNVLLDMVLKRKGYEISVKLFRKIRERTYGIMENIFCLVKILSVTENDIQDAFARKWRDFEDCVQYMTGQNNRMDYLITVNKKDYKDIFLPVLTPAEWLELNRQT